VIGLGLGAALGDLGVDMLAALVGGRGVERALHIHLERVLTRPEGDGPGLLQHVAARFELSPADVEGVVAKHVLQPWRALHLVEIEVAYRPIVGIPRSGGFGVAGGYRGGEEGGEREDAGDGHGGS